MSITRREILTGAAALTASTLLATPAISQAQHPFHEFLTAKNIDSSTAPPNLTVNFTDSNRSRIKIASGDVSKIFDIRTRHTPEEQIVDKIRSFVVEQLGAKPILAA